MHGDAYWGVDDEARRLRSGRRDLLNWKDYASHIHVILLHCKPSGDVSSSYLCVSSRGLDPSDNRNRCLETSEAAEASRPLVQKELSSLNLSF